jgi:enoyl-CoA hydratase
MTDTEASTAPSDDLVHVAFPATAPDTGDQLQGVALVTLNRPKALNALSGALIQALNAKLNALDEDETCRAIVITGSGARAFAAGADIAELAQQTPESLRGAGPIAELDQVAMLATPTIAAVRGYALGGGCELAMACDMLIAGDDAVFAQPEIGLGIMPGAGGSQRLTRAIGKAKAMELVLTGTRISAAEADRLGLVTRVVPAAETVAAALALAQEIAALSPVAVRAVKAAVNAAEDLPLSDGLNDEWDRFVALFGTEDQAEGMAAFLAKRKPVWRGR